MLHVRANRIATWSLGIAAVFLFAVFVFAAMIVAAPSGGPGGA